MPRSLVVSPAAVAVGARRLLRIAGLSLIALAGLTCRDRSLTGPGLSVPARVSLATDFPVAPQGAPQLVLTRVRAVLEPVGGSGGDSLVTVADYEGDSAVLVFNVSLLDASQLFRYRITAVDASGDTLFRAGPDTIRATAGTNLAFRDAAMRYAGPDARAKNIRISPAAALILAGGATQQLSVTGTDSSDVALSKIRVGWTTRDATASTVGADGRITASMRQTATWIVARTYTGIADSVLVTVRAPVASVKIGVAPPTIVRGTSASLTAQIFDVSTPPIVLSDTGRSITWLSSNAAAVSVTTAGVVTGNIARDSAWIIAVSEGKRDSVKVKVDPRPVASVAASPDSVNVVLGQPLTVSATAVDDTQAPNPDFPIVWSTSDATTATVTNAGAVTTLKVGRVVLRATAGTQSDSVIVRVVPATSVGVAPKTTTLASLGDTLVLTATITGNGQTGALTWVSRVPATVEVDANTAGLAANQVRVIARANGASYVVVTEPISGNRDSALVTVQQQLASVAVSPPSANIFIGGTQQYTFAGLDARGNALPSPQYFWTHTNNTAVSLTSGGLATGLALGVDTVKAVSGNVTGVAVLNVVTRIARIAVSPDTATLTSLGVSRSFSATAYDAAGAAIPNVAFTFASSNPSVASVQSATATGVTVLSQANGATAVRATAEGVTGEATLTVRQQLAAIEVSPTAATIGLNGRMALIARGRDANGRYIPGSISGLLWSSDATQFASVDASSGLVTGVAYGTANITARSGQLTSNAVRIDVSPNVQARITFGRDTIVMGRSAQLSVPVYLTSAPGAAVTVNLTSARPNVAHFNVASITFGQGQTSQNVTLVSDSAGVALVTATDPTGLYGPGTAAVKVQANVQIVGSQFYLNAGEQRQTTVLLSDPAPAGGMYVAFQFSTAGVGQVSPDPAFIPAGLLSADVTIRGVSAGTTNITPVAEGANGSSFYLSVSASALTIYCNNYYYYCAGNNTPTPIGEGQYDLNDYYVATPQNVVSALAVSVASSDPSVLAVSPAQITIPANGRSQYFRVDGLRLGVSTVTATAANWTAASQRVVVTTPRLIANGGGTLASTAPAQNISVYTADSTGTTHPRITPLTVRLASTDTTVIKVIDSVAVVPAGLYYVNNLKVQPNGSGGTARVIVTAAGHRPDTVTYTVTPPALTTYVLCSYYYNCESADLGVGQFEDQMGRIYIPNAATSPLIVSIRSTRGDSSVIAFQRADTIAVGQTSTTYEIRGKSVGTDTLIVERAGYTSDTAVVRVSNPIVRGSGGGTINLFAQPTAVNAYVADASGNQHPLSDSVRVSFTSSNPAVITVDSAAVTIPKGQSTVPSARQARVTAVGAGTARIYVSAPGFNGGAIDSSIVFTVAQPRLGIAAIYGYYYNTTGLIGLRQNSGSNGGYVQIPNARSAAVPVTLTRSGSNVLRVASSVTIAAGQTTVYFDYDGLALGRDTIIATAAGYLPDTVVIMVTTPRLSGSGLPGSALTTSSPTSVAVSAIDSIGYGHPTLDTVAVRVTSSNTNVLQVDSIYIHIPKGSTSSRSTPVRFVGPGTAFLVYTDSAGLYRPDTTNTVTVTGPSLSANYSSITNPMPLGMRQHSGTSSSYVTLYVQTANAVQGSPLTVSLSLQQGAERVINVPATVTIPVGQSSAPIDVVGLDTTGLVQVDMSAPGYGPTHGYVRVRKPKFVVNAPSSGTTTQVPGTFSVTLTDSTNQRLATEDIVVTLSSTAPNVASPTTTTLTIPAGQSSSSAGRVRFNAPGTAQIVASDARTERYAYLPDSSNVITVTLAKLAFGLGNSVTVSPGQFVSYQLSSPTNTHTDTLRVTLTHKQPSVSTTAAQLKLPPGSFQSLLDSLRGVAVGTDTVIASASGYNPDTLIVTVGLGQILTSGWPTSLLAGDSAQVRLFLRDQAGNGRSATAATTFTLTPNANLTFTSGGATSQTITSITFAANASSSPFFYVKGVSSGSGSATIGNANYTTYTSPAVTINPVAAVTAGADFTFTPPTVSVGTGGAVRWTFQGTTHNVVFDSPPGSVSNISNQAPGSTATRTFGTAGTYNYHCSIHGTATSGMRGTVQVQSGAQGQVAAAKR